MSVADKYNNYIKSKNALNTAENNFKIAKDILDNAYLELFLKEIKNSNLIEKTFFDKPVYRFENSKLWFKFDHLVENPLHLNINTTTKKQINLHSEDLIMAHNFEPQIFISFPNSFKTCNHMLDSEFVAKVNKTNDYYDIINFVNNVTTKFKNFIEGAN